MKYYSLFLLLAVAALGQQGQLASNFTASGTGGNGFLQLANQSSAPATPTGAGRFYFNSSNQLCWKDASGRVVNFSTNGSYTVTLNGSPTLNDWFNQSVKTTASPSFNQVTSTVATGTAPFVVSSTTAVANLNASLLLGGTWAIPGAIGATTPAAGSFTTLAATVAGGQARTLASSNATGVYERITVNGVNKGYWGTADQTVSGGSVNDLGLSASASLILDAVTSVKQSVGGGVVTNTTSTGLSVTGSITGTVTTVANLPSASPAGQLRFVSDATSAQGTNSGAVAAGGGSNTRPVWSDNTNWRYF